MVKSKAQLAVILSKIKGFDEPNAKLEQYSTDSEIAAAILWFSYMQGDIKDRTIADLGAGTGILGLGALLLGAKQVYFLEIDKQAIQQAKNNYKRLKSEYNIGQAIFVNKEISDFKVDADAVIENPPFGVKNEHSDRKFLLKAMETANKVYSLHKCESKAFIEALCRDNGFRSSERLKFHYPLKASLGYHTRRIYRFKVSLFVLEKA